MQGSEGDRADATSCYGDSDQDAADVTSSPESPLLEAEARDSADPAASKAQILVRPFQAGFPGLLRDVALPADQQDQQAASDLPRLDVSASSPLMFSPFWIGQQLPWDPPELSVRFHLFWTQQCEGYTGQERLSRLKRGLSTYATLSLETTMEHWARCAVLSAPLHASFARLVAAMVP